MPSAGSIFQHVLAKVGYFGDPVLSPDRHAGLPFLVGTSEITNVSKKVQNHMKECVNFIGLTVRRIISHTMFSFLMAFWNTFSPKKWKNSIS